MFVDATMLWAATLPAAPALRPAAALAAAIAAAQAAAAALLPWRDGL